MATMKTTDPYMDRVQQQADPIVRRAQERMLRAARAALEAKDQLTWALQDLARHPDYIRTARAMRKGKTLGASLTLAWWAHGCIRGVLQDAKLEDAADWLFEDSNPRRMAATLRLFVDTEARDLARRARRRPAKQKAAELVMVPQAA